MDPLDKFSIVLVPSKAFRLKPEKRLCVMPTTGNVSTQKGLVVDTVSLVVVIDHNKVINTYA
jgi:hypothetical protein